MTYTICLASGEILYTTTDRQVAFTKLDLMADIYEGQTVDLWEVNFLGRSDILMSSRV